MTDKVMHAAIRNLAAQIGKVSAKQRASEVRKATVVAVSYNIATGQITADLNISGDTTVVVPGVNVVQGVSPNVGDVVNVLKQGPTLTVISQIGTQTSAGWTTLALASGFGHNGNSQGNVQYRCVNDHGSLKMQWRGAFSVSGSVTQVNNVQLDASFRPTNDCGFTCPRGVGNGPAFIDIQVKFTAVGNVFITGGTATLSGVAAGTTPDWVSLHGVSYYL